MEQQRKQRIVAFISSLSVTILLLLLMGFQSLWVIRGTAANLMRQVGLQQSREQRIVASVLILAYRPVDEHTQAISTLQNILPIWEKTQRGLVNGDDSLGLPKRSPQDIQILLLQATPDYIAIDTAAKMILAHTERPVPSEQLQIILDHQNDYYVSMSQITALWQSHIDAVFYQLFYWEVGITAIVMLLAILSYCLITRRLFRNKPPPACDPKMDNDQLTLL